MNTDTVDTTTDEAVMEFLQVDFEINAVIYCAR